MRLRKIAGASPAMTGRPAILVLHAAFPQRLPRKFLDFLPFLLYNKIQTRKKKTGAFLAEDCVVLGVKCRYLYRRKGYFFWLKKAFLGH